MTLPKNFLVDATLKRLGAPFLELYNDKISYDIREFLILIFYEEFLEPETNRQRNLKEVKAYYFKNKFKKTKRNWYNSVKKSLIKPPKTPKGLLAELDYIQDGIEKGFLNLKSNYNVKSMDELIELRLTEIKDWVDDDSKCLSDFKYIKDKTPLQITNAMKCDAIMTATQMIIDDYGGEITSIVKEVNDLISELPLPGKNDKFRATSLKKEENNGNIIVDQYTSEDVSVTTIFDKNLFKNNKSVSLTEKDYQIFNYVLSKRDIEFIERQKIFVDIGDIVKNIYSSRGKKEYAQVAARLSKLKDISFKIEENGSVYMFDLFDHVIFFEDGIKVEIKLNEMMHQKYIDHQLTRIYSDKLKSFQLDISENMVFILQKERFYHLTNPKDNIKHNHLFIYPYEFFTRRIRFPSRNKENNIKLIEQSLREIVSNKVTVARFNRAHDVFHIEFIPVSSHEAEDLISSNTIKPLLDIGKQRSKAD